MFVLIFSLIFQLTLYFKFLNYGMKFKEENILGTNSKNLECIKIKTSSIDKNLVLFKIIVDKFSALLFSK
jgi:hypothetical protein